MKKTLGGDRLGSGSKMQVELHGYERSTHDLGYLWRSTMSAGTLVPFLSEVALPGDTFDINLGADIKTHPTVGPLFGSYKVQLDIFLAPVRLYQGQLHNNKLGIGMEMATIKLPQIELTVTHTPPADTTDYENSQINPSCILSYLGIRGVGKVVTADTGSVRHFNAIPLLAYWDIYKNYYANKQEEIGAVIHAPFNAINATITDMDWGANDIPAAPAVVNAQINDIETITIAYTGAAPLPEQVIMNVILNGAPLQLSLQQIASTFNDNGAGIITAIYNYAQYGPITVRNYEYISDTQLIQAPPQVQTFPLSNLDDMRELMLTNVAATPPFIVNDPTGTPITPYTWVLDWENDKNPMLNSQEGLAIKTYQSDLFNNWLSTEWIDGAGGINEITAVDTSGGSFSIDTLNLSKKVYDMLNRIAVSGGSYDDWMDAVWAHDRYTRCETPMYMGGLIKELVFQEVVSNAESTGATTPIQPLGSLAGKGIMAKKHKGGQIRIKVDEPSYIIGIISLTPRIDYSQGNKWDTHLLTMDDFHKPALDEIGFQELITEQMAWWTTENNGPGDTWLQKSAGKQPAWINYMTNVNQTRGTFAIGAEGQVGEMFMTLNRRYERNTNGNDIEDLTTYIDPVKFNHIFAQTAIDAQNFWAQIAVDITARRKMSAKIMPNL